MTNGPLVIALIAVLGLTGWSEPRPTEWPHAGPMPDDPVKIKALRYDPITKGNQSYRPIDPMPWDGVNKRVAPQGSLPPDVQGQPTVAPNAGGPSRAATPGISTTAKGMPPASPSAPSDHGAHGAPKP